MRRYEYWTIPIAEFLQVYDRTRDSSLRDHLESNGWKLKDTVRVKRDSVGCAAGEYAVMAREVTDRVSEYGLGQPIK